MKNDLKKWNTGVKKEQATTQEQARTALKPISGNSSKKSVKLKPLANRQTRIRLLCASLEDAQTASTTNEAKGRGGKHWVIPHRNEELWLRGSYKELERSVEHLRELHHGLYRAFHKVFVHDPYNKIKPDYSADLLADAIDGFKIVDKLMPRDVFVPADISENAGYLKSEAKQYNKVIKKKRIT